MTPSPSPYLADEVAVDYLVGAYNIAGTFHHLKGQFEEALELLSKSTQLRPESSNCIMRFASAMLDSGKVTLAMQMYESAIARDPDNAHLHFHQGQGFFAQQKFDKAKEEFRKAMELDEKCVGTQHAQSSVGIG